MLTVEGLHTYYGQVHALRGVSLHVEEGMLLAIIGANGAGKSTLLGTIAGVYTPRQGRIRLAGREIAGSPAEAVVRLGLSLVPERRQVFTTLTVRENLILGAFHRIRRERARVGPDLAWVYRIFPRLQERERQLAGTLSGGEQQMLAIGRGLMGRPRLLLVDEPSLGLAPRITREIMAVFAALRDREGVTVVLVEQNVRAALRVADAVCVMDRGDVVLQGSPAELESAGRLQSIYLGGGLY